MTLQERLVALLNDPRTRKAAARVAQDWRETDDVRQLELAVEAIEKRRSELDEAEVVKTAKSQEAHGRVKELLEMRVPRELLSDLLADIDGERFEEAHRKADAIRESFLKIRRGQPGVEMTWRGAWNEDVRYEPGDSVRYLGIAYVCLVETLDRPAVEGVRAWMALVDPYTLAAYVSGGGGGATDHGSLSGLGDDDHPQYLTQAEADALYDPLGGGGGGSVATDTIWDAKGDLAGGTGADTAARLAVGTDGQVLSADSTQATGLKWVTNPAGVTDHGALTGLADDDHAQYLKEEASGGAASEVPDHTHASGAEAGGTLSPATLNLPAAAGPAQTVDGQVVWDSDDNLLTVGDGASRQTFLPVVDATSDPTNVSATASADGTEASAARKDHRHVHAQIASGDLHTEYVPEAIVDAKGDLIAASAADTPARLGVGADDTILMADSAQATGLKWVASGAPSTQAFGDSAAEGTTDGFTRTDHKHAMPADPTGGQVRFSGAVTTSTATGAITGLAVTNSVWRWNGASAATLHGIASGAEGRLVLIENVTTGQTLTLANDSATEGTAANRIFTPNSNDRKVGPNSALWVAYDNTSSRWRVVERAAYASTPAAVSTAGSAGTAGELPARGDHAHAHEAAHINHDTTWAAKGDLIVGTANDTAAVLTVGSNDQVPVADSAQSSGLQYRTMFTQTTFSKTGTLTTGTGATRWYNDTGRTLTIDSTRGSVGTAPTGASILVDVNINGTSIWATTQANRITIAVSTNTDQGGTPDDATIANGEYLTVDIDQVGSTVAGADLTVQVWMKG